MPSSLQRSQVEPTDASRVPSVAEECGGSEPDPVVASPLHWFHLYFPERKFTEDLEVLIDDYDTHRATTRATTLAASSPGAAFLVANKQGGPSQPLKSSTNGRAQANLTFPSLNVEQLAKQGKDFDLIFADRRCESREQAAQWLAQLRHMLRPDGVLHLTLPGRYGNQGLEMLRQLIRLMEIRPGAQGKAKVDTLLRNLCENDTVKLDRYETEALSQNPRLAHMLFEPGHVSFSVPECLALIRAAGLRFQRFFYQAHYLPQCSTLAKQPDLLTDVLALECGRSSENDLDVGLLQPASPSATRAGHDVEHHERQPPVAFQRIAGQPEISPNRSSDQAPAPGVELAGRLSAPVQPCLDAGLCSVSFPDSYETCARTTQSSSTATKQKR